MYRCDVAEAAAAAAEGSGNTRRKYSNWIAFARKKKKRKNCNFIESEHLIRRKIVSTEVPDANVN